MRRSLFYFVGLTVLALSMAASATDFTFNTDPFAGTPVLTVPGRQIVGGELFINFKEGTDHFIFDASAFGLTGPVNFVNSTAANLPSTGINVVVLETLDNDNNPLTPFGSGNAADLIADKLTTPGAGFFIYFNQSLDMPRLVFSTDLSSSSADLRILARILNDQGRPQSLAGFTAEDFTITSPSSSVPEPASLFLAAAGLLGIARVASRKEREREEQ